MNSPFTRVNCRYVQGMFFLIALIISGCGLSPARQAEDAIENGDIDTLRRILEEGLDPNHIFPGPNRGYRLVHVAAEYANLEAMELLVSRNADINVRDNLRGATPLMLTVIFRKNYGVKDDRYLEVFKYLLSQGADLQTRSREGFKVFLYVDEYTTDNPEFKKELERALENRGSKKLNLNTK